MVAYSATKNLALVANSSYVGTWDVPTNSNWDIVDAAIGGAVAISLNNSNVILSAPQYQQNQITFNSTLTGSVVITFPSTYTGTYAIYNTCSGSSAFIVTLATATSTGLRVCAPPGEIVDIINDGNNIRYKNLGRIGGYWDYAGSSVPAWVDGCSIPPYLNCNATTFSSVTYPVLATILGGTTLPDSQGNARAALNQGTNRLTSSNNGVDGNTIFATGGGSVTLSSRNLPNITFPYTDPGHDHVEQRTFGGSPGIGIAQDATVGSAVSAIRTVTNTIGITINSGGSGIPVTMATPTYIGGIVLIRAA